MRAWGRRRAQGADIRQLIAVAEQLEGPSREQREENQVIASLRLLRFYLECGRPHRATRLIPRLQAKLHALDQPEPYLAVLGELESELMFARGHFEEAETIGLDALAFCANDSRGIEQRRGSPQYLKGKGEPGLHQFCSISRVDLWFNGFVHYDSITIV